MTTETLHRTRETGARVLGQAALAALATTLTLAILGGLTAGSATAYAALVGGLLVLMVFGAGAFAVDAVASILPSASLLVALLTYTLQVVVLGLVFWALSESGAVGTTLTPAWLAGAVIAGTLAWLTVQTRQTMRRRIPVYDLPAPASPGGEG